MTYVLMVIAMLGWQGRTITFQEFSSQEKCEEAKFEIITLLKKEGSRLPMICVSK